MFSVFLDRNRNTIAYNYESMIEQSFSTVKCFPEKFRWHLYLKGGGGGRGAQAILRCRDMSQNKQP